MVKHSKNLSSSEVRELVIPKIFKELNLKDYILKKTEQKVIPDVILEQKPRPKFHIFDMDKTKVATFLPNGHSECYDEKFRPIFEKIKKKIKNIENEF
ncbi:MAG: hypothetical protein ACTSUV_00805 [Candidatus Ranarchaeia archaeon]